jgi:hypothetical protein
VLLFSGAPFARREVTPMAIRTPTHTRAVSAALYAVITIAHCAHARKSFLVAFAVAGTDDRGVGAHHRRAKRGWEVCGDPQPIPQLE